MEADTPPARPASIRPGTAASSARPTTTISSMSLVSIFRNNRPENELCSVPAGVTRVGNSRKSQFSSPTQIHEIGPASSMDRTSIIGRTCHLTDRAAPTSRSRLATVRMAAGVNTWATATARGRSGSERRKAMRSASRRKSRFSEPLPKTANTATITTKATPSGRGVDA
jgi:hypothetical protein